ncbi:STAS domain-containing protein [Paenibacillus sp. 1P07SE]|uniref:STAS domain-containing protein n=1 Tax=Paenibacillus sp. 1P07SE TaxID=3132209 RepID=UPI0039A623C0
MEITIQQVDDVVVIQWKGRLDSASMTQAEQHFLRLWDGGCRRIVFRLDELDYVSSAGLRVMLLTVKKSRADEGRVAFCLLRDNVREILDISGFTQIFPLFATLEAAAAYTSAKEGG